LNPQPFWLVFTTPGWVNQQIPMGNNFRLKTWISESAAILAHFHRSWFGKPTDSYEEEF